MSSTDYIDEATRLLKEALATDFPQATPPSAPAAPIFHIGTAANVAQTLVIGQQVQHLDSPRVTQGSDDNAGKPTGK